ncbi:hypothetical protein QYE76_056614 [Lolium multiflorum]|uniref:Uncharacterized protein n=1 Tax=Lolium multiflorum TaxID=4521 RepID=A0AAD8WQN1_LOLMU|nr:hypothetical protein QYE76_056614 [Lolium multiflorum]
MLVSSSSAPAMQGHGRPQPSLVAHWPYLVAGGRQRQQRRARVWESASAGERAWASASSARVGIGGMATGSEAGKSAEAVLEWPKQDKKRMLHAVYRVGDLEKTIKRSAYIVAMAKDRALHLLPSPQTCAGLVLTLHNTALYEKPSGRAPNCVGMAAPDRFLSVSIALLEMEMWHMVEKFRAEVVDSSSDDESDHSAQTLATTAASMIHEVTSNPGPVHRGSVKGRSKNLSRNRVAGQTRLHKDYFHLTNPVFPEKVFRCRYRMSRDLFLVILRGVKNYDPYFQCMPDATVFNRLMQGKAPRVTYEFNGNEYDKPYYLADSIYPDWATLVKTVRNPNSEKTRSLPRCKRLAGKIWSTDLVCSKLGGQLSITRQEHGRRRPCMR